ncbi:class III lanthionine synthetase LanKC [Microbacterium sp. RURRCA19A]|uniref:class III lanthionine synthetase LanKC n=1 Tax=Microbacterium sp. RURRCA19A TaxID=1907391 RepID=UPI00095493D6|nr:class III lanthionine synthetase LanKC [Microbacterium sp. RURRCA19A]SIR93663.1 Protein kinase domain-containing protein [Microbacterium sp. RURRCA19A]
MDAIYPVFARADRIFYEHPGRARVAADDPAFAATVPASWRRADDGIWTYYEPAGAVLPEQGWKIHLSTTPAAAPAILRIVSDHCVRGRIPFKHLSRESVLAASNGKDAGREGSGKFVTIYPSTIGELERSLRELGRRTADFDGPHILSDLRWTRGPVFVRYGGFLRMLIEVDGVPTPAVRHPDGHLVPDVRSPGFEPPSWVEIPPFLRDAVRELGELRPPDGFPQITGVLHHSNAGGVYTAVEGGRDAVVKEARPFAGVTVDGLTAVDRAAREAHALRTIAAPGTVELIREFEALGHRYLVLGRARGVPLHQAVVARHPLVSADCTASDVAEYRRWAVALAARIARVVDDVHAAGFSHGDLHPGNVLVDDDGAVTLIDFEMARSAAENAPVAIGAPGFVAPDFAEPEARAGRAGDLFALRRILLFLFAPLTPVLDLHVEKEREVRAWVVERFGLGAADRDALGFAADPVLPAEAVDRDDRIAAAARQLVADATPEREDRLWPGDPAQFDEPAYAVAHGALGPLLALHAATGTVPEDAAGWAARAMRTAPPQSGLFDGLAGAAAAWEELGDEAHADEAIARCLDAPLRWSSPGLYGGPLGTALGLLRSAGRHPELVDVARHMFDEAADRADGWAGAGPGKVATGAGGLLRGPSGAAIVALSLYDRQADTALLALAEAAVRQDLESCLRASDGSLQMNEGWRLLPYLGSGSAGVGHALAAVIERHPATPLASQLRSLARAAEPEFVLEPGLFQGRAGLLLFLAGMPRAADGTEDAAVARVRVRHERSLTLHAIPRPVGTGYPGRALLRLSCDLGTGSAGVLWALAAVRDGQRRTLPFLDLPPVHAARAVMTSERG